MPRLPETCQDYRTSDENLENQKMQLCLDASIGNTQRFQVKAQSRRGLVFPPEETPWECEILCLKTSDSFPESRVQIARSAGSFELSQDR